MDLDLLDSNTGLGITGASFDCDWVDYGDGWYYLAAGTDQWVFVSAPGYVSVYFDTDNYSYAYLYLTSAG